LRLLLLVARAFVLFVRRLGAFVVLLVRGLLTLFVGLLVRLLLRRLLLLRRVLLARLLRPGTRLPWSVRVIRVRGAGVGQLGALVAAVVRAAFVPSVRLVSAVMWCGRLLRRQRRCGGLRLRSGCGCRGRVRRGRAGRLRGGTGDGDRQPDGLLALATESVADHRGQTSLQDSLCVFVRYAEQRGARDEHQRLAVTEPALVLGFDALTVREELLQHSWPHCGKIGRQFSHGARFSHSLGVMVR
jgi:hypothetical protein